LSVRTHTNIQSPADEGEPMADRGGRMMNSSLYATDFQPSNKSW